MIATAKGKRLIYSLLLRPLSISIIYTIEIYVSNLMVTNPIYSEFGVCAKYPKATF